jgi:hypothetical protein
MEHQEHERKVLQGLHDLLFELDGRIRAQAVGYLGTLIVGEQK